TITTSLDQRRVRAFGIQILERAATDGNTLLTDTQFITKFDELPLQPLCNPSLRNLRAIDEFLKDEITINLLDPDEELYYFKLKRFVTIKENIRSFVQKRIRRKIDPPIQQPWLELIEKGFGKIDSAKPLWYQEKDRRARQEKAIALEILSNSRFS